MCIGRRQETVLLREDYCLVVVRGRIRARRSAYIERSFLAPIWCSISEEKYLADIGTSVRGGEEWHSVFTRRRRRCTARFADCGCANGPRYGHHNNVAIETFLHS
ncbi:hypothetical protein EVAR_51186_1 [Eumeta japonica]|uniref:Uncharacterized protein n=1 Tax=Eumeta variegata TaxID=151549 RepID=A0A4C1XCY2_EUMVA|nr:hypothetical protein EVAR_51186_1 [Eumeta japonica]